MSVENSSFKKLTTRPTGTRHELDTDCADTLRNIANEAANMRRSVVIPTAIALTVIEIAEFEDSWSEINPTTKLKERRTKKREVRTRVLVSIPPQSTARKVKMHDEPWLYFRDGNACGKEGIMLRLLNDVTASEIRVGRIKEAAGERHGKGSGSISKNDSK